MRDYISTRDDRTIISTKFKFSIFLDMRTRKPVNIAVPAGTSRKYRCIIDFGTASDRKSWKIWLTEYSSTRSGIHHACMRCSARDSTCMHARMSWPAVSKELLAVKYARVAPRCRTVWPHCWPQTALHQQRSLCLLCKIEPTPVVGHLTHALLSRF
jgi:hypothetical protein